MNYPTLNNLTAKDAIREIYTAFIGSDKSSATSLSMSSLLADGRTAIVVEYQNGNIIIEVAEALDVGQKYGELVNQVWSARKAGEAIEGLLVIYNPKDEGEEADNEVNAALGFGCNQMLANNFLEAREMPGDGVSFGVLHNSTQETLDEYDLGDSGLKYLVYTAHEATRDIKLGEFFGDHDGRGRAKK